MLGDELLKWKPGAIEAMACVYEKDLDSMPTLGLVPVRPM
jgi:hypothetical protein